MDIRLLGTPEERYSSSLISVVAFHSRVPDPDRLRAEAAASTDEDWGAFTDDGHLAAHIINNHFTVMLDGHRVMSGGIGAVSTLPEFREEGCIRQIFASLLPAARARGEVISTLYPFSRAFYRKMGYETVCAKNVYEFPPQTLRPYKYKGSVTPYAAGADAQAYLALYQEFAARYNCMLVRGIEDMNRKLEKCGPETGTFAYLLEDAYLILKDEGETLAVKDCAWTSPAGFNAMLGFLSRYTADYFKVRLTMPVGVELWNIIRSAGDCDIRKTTSSVFMARIMNTEKALACLRLPAGTSFTVKVTDDWLPENCGTYLVTDTGVTRTAASTDLEADIRALAQLLTGAVTLYEAELAPGVKVHGNRDTLERVFVRKAIFVEDNY